MDGTPTRPDQSHPDDLRSPAEGGDSPDGSGAVAVPEAAPKTEEDFASLYQESIEGPEEGQILHGTVIKVLKEYVAVDIGRKSEGMLPVEDLSEEERKALAPGNRIDVMVERFDQEHGFVLLSRSKVLKIQVWNDLQKAYEEGTPVAGTIVAKVKGGYTVDVGVKAFLPGSQVDLRPVRETEDVIGLSGHFKIIKLSRKKANVVVSRRAWQEEEREAKRRRLLETIKEGDVVQGKVKNITEYGVFLDLGGLDGLMHVTDMSYGKVTNPASMCAVGDVLTVKVIRFDREKGRISLGLKQMRPDPWADIDQRYQPGARVKGRVTNLTRYGAFVELEPGVEGLLHVSEMSWSKRLRDPSEMLKAGDAVEVVVLRVEKEHKKISLGLKQLLPNPWDELRAMYPEGSIVEGVVKNVTDFGVFVDIGGEIDGLVHISDLTWNQRIRHPSELVKKGDRVRAKVLRISPENQKFSLGMKQLQPDPWAGVAGRFRKGDLVQGTVTRVADFGVFVEVAEGVEGLVHISELSPEKVDHPNALFKAGDQVGALVLAVDPGNRKLSLSIRGYHEEMERRQVESYMSKPADGGNGMTVLGEALSRAKVKVNGD